MKLTSNGMIHDICSQRSRAVKFLNLDKPYYNILKYLTDKDYYEDEYINYPSLYDLRKDLNLSYDIVRKNLIKLYKDLSNYDSELSHPFEINKVSVYMSLKGFHESKSISFKNLPIIPKKGQRISVPYFKELVGSDFFYVKEVSHDFLDDEQVVFIWLSTEISNAYWEIRKDQAIETGEISYRDTMKNKWELKKILDLRPTNAW